MILKNKDKQKKYKHDLLMSLWHYQVTRWKLKTDLIYTVQSDNLCTYENMLNSFDRMESDCVFKLNMIQFVKPLSRGNYRESKMFTKETPLNKN